MASLHIGRTGRAAIVDRDGHVIAAPELLPPASADGRRRVPTVTGTLNDPALTDAFDRFRVEGYGKRTIDVGGAPFVALASRMPAAGQDWILLIAAPQSDFTGFAEENSRKNVLLSLITIGLTALLGLALLWQNRRFFKLARLLAKQRTTGAREFQALSALAAQPGLFDPDRPMPSLTATLAEMSAARRVSIWHLAGEDQTLQCEDQFEQQSGHTEGLELSRSQLPLFFQALDRGEAIETLDAAADKRTVALHHLLMRPFASHTLSVLPIHGPGGISGAVMLEDAAEPAQARSFAEAVSSIAAMRITARRPKAGAAPPDLALDGIYPVPSALGGAGSFSPTLRPDTVDPTSLHAGYFPSVTAMVIQLDDAVALAKSDGTGVMALADQIAKAMQAIATRYALPYMKLTGHTLVAAVGYTPVPDPSATRRLVDAALAARESCIALLAQSGLEPVFRIGIDFGAAFGCLLGQEPRQFNLWGDVIRTAELMAGSVTDSGSIQVSERAYGQLRQQFLFRARGVFYLPRVGTARLFIMAGRR